MKKTTVLLDIDGTLVDSNDAHARSWVEALKDFGIDAEYEDVRKKIGMGGDKLLPSETSIDEESELGKKISERRAEIFKKKYLPQLSAFPQTRELLDCMLKKGLQLVVATSASKEDLTAILEQAHLSDLLVHRVTSDDAENSKPDPDILEAALKKMKVTPDEAIMIGDTPYDIEAASKAKVESIGFKTGGWNEKALAGAQAIFEGPSHLLQKFNESPLST